MQTEDKGEFTKLLAATMAVYERQITSGVAEIFFAAMAQYPLPIVREALNRHLQDPEGGRFAPKPADLIRQIVTAKAADGRPGRDEAWAIAQRASDEYETVMVSDEILGALEVARPLLEGRDKVAARMAFLEAYDRLVADKRSTGEPFKWRLSLGIDKSKRANAIQLAHASGQIGRDEANGLLLIHSEEKISGDGLAIAGLLAGPKPKDPEELRSRWQEIKAGISKAKHGKVMREQEDFRQAERELQEMAERKRDQS